MTTTTTAPNPTCFVCSGTGVDDAFGGPCDCARMAALDARLARQYGTTDEAAGPGYARQSNGSGTGRGSARTFGATEKQKAFFARLMDEALALSDDDRYVGALTGLNEAFTAATTTKAASQAIDMLLDFKKTHAGRSDAAPVVRANRYAANCAACGTRVAEGHGRIDRNPAGKWITSHLDGQCRGPIADEVTVGLDLRPLESMTSRGIVRLAVPGGDTRLKVRVKFATNGTIYVEDAAEYGQRQSYGSQRPGQAYRGKIVDALTAILADPATAAVAYTELTGECAVCARHLEDETSVARGIGPVCARKLGIA